MFKTKLAAAAAALLAAGSAQAGIISFNTPITVPSTIDGVYINLATGAKGASGAAVPGFDFNPYSSSGTILFYWGGDTGSPNAGVSDGTKYLDLAPGTVVSSTSTFIQSANGVNNETANFQTVGTHTLGFKFLNESTNAVDYGYLKLQVGGTGGFPATILGWSFDNTGAAITVPGGNAGVPEPASWAMMISGFGLVGGAMRRRQQASGASFA